MATSIKNSIPGNDTDAHFQAWIQMFYDAIVTALGFVQTLDTGQLAVPIVVVKPTTTNQVSGYLVFKPGAGDTADSTVSIRLKIEFGSTAFGAAMPGIWVTVGTGTDGAGNITGQIGTRKQVAYSSNSTTTLFSSYFSGDGSKGRLMFALWPTANLSGGAGVLVIDRVPDSSGNPSTSGFSELLWTGSGVIYAKHWQNNSGALTMSGDDSQYPGPWGNITTGIIGSFAPIFPAFPLIGYVANPLLGVMAMYRLDIGQLQSFSFTVYGSVHTYMSIKGTSNQDNGGNAGNTVCPCILWE